MRKKIIKEMIRNTFILRGTILILIAGSCASLTGCQAPVIFEKKKSAYEITELSVDELEDDTYYVKSGTKFIEVYLPTASFQGGVDMPSSDRVIYMQRKEALIPTLYKGDTIVFRSTKLDVSALTLERFKDCGYSIGIYGAIYDEDTQLLSFKRDQNVIENSPADQALASYSDDIGIQTIDSNYVSAASLDESGNITGLERNQTYEIGYYEGTQYATANVEANRHVLESWEMISIPESNVTKTKMGYLSIAIPEDFKPGWYYIKDAGFFKYIDHAKGDGENPEGTEMNVEYYASKTDALKSYSQMYAVNFDKNTAKPTIEVIYDAGSLSTGQTAQGYVIAPDETQYDMKQSDEKPLIDDSTDIAYTSGSAKKAYLTCSLDMAMAGKWQVVLTPKSLSILEVKVIDNGLAEGATEVEKIYAFDSPQKQITFYGKWQGSKEANVYGYLIYPDGTTYNFKNDENNQMLLLKRSYLPAGTYTIKLYHYSDTILTEDDIDYTTDMKALQEEEIIFVTG